MENKIKKVTIDESVCIGCGACNVAAPDAFGYDEEKSQAVVKQDAENTDNKKIEAAAEDCPVQAIKIEK